MVMIIFLIILFVFHHRVHEVPQSFKYLLRETLCYSVVN